MKAILIISATILLCAIFYKVGQNRSYTGWLNKQSDEYQDLGSKVYLYTSFVDNTVHIDSIVLVDPESRYKLSDTVINAISSPDIWIQPYEYLPAPIQ